MSSTAGGHDCLMDRRAKKVLSLGTMSYCARLQSTTIFSFYKSILDLVVEYEII